MEAARDLSLPDLLRVLNEKILLERARVQDTIISPALSTTSLETEIESIETGAHDLLRLALSLRNTSQPVNRSPSAILSQIARYVPHEDDDSYTRTIVPLTHVCRHWREFIISTPENWTVISNRCETLAVLSLQRAKAASLDVSLDMRIRNPGFHDLLSPLIKNIRSFHLYGISEIEDLIRAFPNLPWSMPALQSLEFRSPRGGNWDGSIDPFKPPSSTTNQLRRLKSLKLADVPLYPSLLGFTTLTRLSLYDDCFNLHSDDLLKFLEANHLLEVLSLYIGFADHSFRSWQRRATMGDRLRSLSVGCENVLDGRALISGVMLQKDAELRFISHDNGAGLSDVLSGVSMAHLSNITISTFIQYQPYPRRIRLHGPNGSASFTTTSDSNTLFTELHLLPLAHIRAFYLVHRVSPSDPTTLSALPLSVFPALETIAIMSTADLSRLLSDLFSIPSSLSSLKNFAFLNSSVTEKFMGELARFAASRKRTTTVGLHRVVIVSSGCHFPSADSIRELGNEIPIVDTRMGTKLPMDISPFFPSSYL